MKTIWIRLILLSGILAASFHSTVPVQAEKANFSPQSSVTAYDLILAMNTLRVSNGLSPLIEDPIINAVAQATAEIMAANQMSWHIGNVSGRLQSAGYGGGAKVYATENFAVGSTFTIDEIMLAWADPDHMIPAVNPAYCHVGAGVAKAANGMTYYVLQAAYVAGRSCGEYRPPANYTPKPGETPVNAGVPQIIVPVKVATPDADGKVFHVVQNGQSLWAIAVAYKVTIRDLEIWNNISRNAPLQVGQKLFIPGSNTAGYATPTPAWMIQIATPDADGRIVHEVKAYQTLIRIAEAYGTTIDALLAYNGIQADWPLQIGQKLIIYPGNITPSPTPRPLTPIEKLTPASDGKYYHTVQSGETLAWIARLYEVSLNDLMVWNGLNATSIIHPGDRILLQVTPPVTPTFTPSPTLPPTATPHPPTATPSPTPTPVVATPTPEASPQSTPSAPWLWVFLILAVAGGGLVWLFSRKRA
ncbi:MULTISPECIES: LysM peptidoglycan-binding domain-containing protein [Anaerolinea]|uniref:LysM peptidoglycan-binding domain-containing protein n=1 Tax=Anaerolinea TaxID=233189 RepID=UPI00262A98C0|nr:LysM peptidoglycan-binding domain-containing protein [Anaerolinea thermophila]